MFITLNLLKKKFNLFIEKYEREHNPSSKKKEKYSSSIKRIKIINNNLRHQSLSQVFFVVDANVLWLKHELTIYLLFEFTLY